jgi:hypothetical protein
MSQPPAALDLPPVWRFRAVRACPPGFTSACHERKSESDEYREGMQAEASGPSKSCS